MIYEREIDQMALIKCKMCGGDLELVQGSTIATCEYCGTTQTVPAADDEKKLVLFERANRYRSDCEFDKAAGVYESIVVDFPEEAEAYWGLILCKYGIEYVDDPATGKKIPTCHRSSFSSLLEDPDLDKVLDNADTLSRKVYQGEARQIEQIRKDILEVSAKEEPYDVFICYKESDEKGERTVDSVMAQDLYNALTEKGYRVFFSRITLEDKLGQQYEPYIFAALNSAKVMLAIGTSYDYYNAVWVKNEWSRFMKLIAKGEKKTLIPCYKDIDAYDMPKEFRALQAQDLGKVGSTQDLLRGIDKLLAKPEKKQFVASESAAMEAFLADQAKREAKEAKSSRKKKAITISILTIVISIILLIFTGYERAGASAWFLEEFCSLIGLTGYACTLPAYIWLFLGANVVAYILHCVALGFAVRRGFRNRIAYIILMVSWLLMVASFTLCEMNGISITAVALGGYSVMLYLSYIYMFIMTLVMNWSPKKLRFWIALSIFAVVFFSGDVGVSTYQSMTYKSAMKSAENGDYETAIEKLAKLDDYKDSRQQIINICTSAEYLNSVEVGDMIRYGSYEQDNNHENGKEVIDWRVLSKEGNQLLVISNQSLDAVAYHSDWMTDVTWETCALNGWLQSEFYGEAFSFEEGMKISGPVTLLTAEEANRYFTSNEDRLCIGTYYTERNKVGYSLNNNGNYDDWWLRGTNTEPSNDAPIVDTYGVIGEESAGGNNPLYQYVRPVIRINVN